MTIYLAPTPVTVLEPTAPYVLVYLPKQLSTLVGSWSVSPSTGDGGATRILSANGSSERAAGGTVVVVGVSSDSTITGNFDVTFPSTGQLRGGFSAHWIPRTFLCG